MRVPDEEYIFLMSYVTPSSFDEPPTWKLVADSTDDRVEVLLQWFFDRKVTKLGDQKVYHQEREIFYLLSEDLVLSPNWQCSLTLWDVDQQQQCTVMFRLSN